MNTAIVFLTKSLTKPLLDFAEDVRKQHAGTFICIDDMDIAPSISITGRMPIICVSDKDTVQAGYHNCTYVDRIKNPCAWDKGIFTFAHLFTEYDRVWFIEDDVFIPSVRALLTIIEKYKDFDLVCRSNEMVTEANDLLWTKITATKERPFYRSMTCAIGVSRNLLNLVAEYAQKNKTLFFHEVLFNTLATRGKLKIKSAPELWPIMWDADWTTDKNIIPKNQEKLFHPVKDINSHKAIRNRIAEYNER